MFISQASLEKDEEKFMLQEVLKYGNVLSLATPYLSNYSLSIQANDLIISDSMIEKIQSIMNM